VNKLLMVTLLLALPISASRQESIPKADPCFDKATTQADMNTCAADASNKADAELNRVYQRLLKKHAGQKNYIAKLELAQEAWVKFRNAHIEFLHPELNEDQVRAEGTVYPMCNAIEITRMIRERIETLKNLLDPKEGDVCGF
jgi:uncharacterized protein YecT (DUF1311 family)